MYTKYCFDSVSCRLNHMDSLSPGTIFAQDHLGSWREVNFASDAAPNTPVLYEMACHVRVNPKSI